MNKKLLILLLVFTSFVVQAFCQCADTTNRRFILQVNAGVTFPVNHYVASSAYSAFSPGSAYMDIYGYANNGTHEDITGIYLISAKFGFVARVGMYLNSTVSVVSNESVSPSTANEYLGGIYFCFNPSNAFHGYPRINIYCMGLVGKITANISNSQNNFISLDNWPGTSSYSYNAVPGEGSSTALYVGAGARCSVYRHCYLNFSFGYLNSDVYFPEGKLTTYTTNTQVSPPSSSTTSSTSTVAMQLKLGVVELNAGISYQF